MKHRRRSLFATLGFLLVAPLSFAADAWAELARPGAIVLFRHATAPGVGDPPGFKLEDCNISALTGVGAASAEGVVVRPAADGTLQVVATLEP